MKKYRLTLLFILLLLFGFFIRIFFLNSFPTWIGDEELELIINAKSIFLTGWSIDTLWSPFNGTVLTNIFPPVPYLFLAPVVGYFPFSPFAAKISSVFVHLGIIVLLFFLVKKFVDTKVALFTLAVSMINPWSFFFSRTNFEAPLAVLFYLSSWVILVYARGYFLLFSFVPIILAFYSYTGTKLILIPFVIGTTFHAWKYIQHKKYTTPYLLFTALCIGLFAFQLYTFQSEAIGQRVGELVLPNAPTIIQSVNNERRLAITNPFTPLITNKMIVYTKYIIGKYFEVFAFPLLFFQGENRATYSLYTHGYFYYIDIIFLILGILFLSKRNKTFLFLLFYLLLIGAIPAVISNNPTGFAALRAALIYPLLCILIGAGIASLLETKKNNRRLIIVGITISILYFFSFVNLGYTYFFRYPMYASEAYGYSKKLLMTYVSHYNALTITPLTIYTKTPNDLFKHYIFSNDLLKKETSDTISTLLNKPIIDNGNIKIVKCDDIDASLLTSTFIVESGDCELKLSVALQEKKYLSIPQLADSGSMYKIYGDVLCSDRPLRRYPELISFSTITDGYSKREAFCDNFIINPFAK